MTISSRYLTNLLLILSAGFLVVATQAFAPATVMWLTFAIAVEATVIGAAMLFAPRNNMTDRMLGGVVSVLGAWTIVASLVFAPATVLWLGFAAALGFVGLAVIGLTAHELTTERVVHSIEIGQPEREEEREPLFS